MSFVAVLLTVWLVVVCVLAFVSHAMNTRHHRKADPARPAPRRIRLAPTPYDHENAA